MNSVMLGVLLHWIGGLAAGSFYVPYRGVKQWSWQTYWLLGGFFSWIIAPWIMAGLLTHNVLGVLSETPAETLRSCYIWGALWGLGGLTFGLTMRYLGMSLGMAVALGYCTVFGTLVPPLLKNEFVATVLMTTSGQVILLGLGVCVAGITLAGLAGMSKEREMSAADKRASIAEFSFVKGLLVATFSGVLSASMSMGIAAGGEIKTITMRDYGTPKGWEGLPVLVIVLLGGFTSNFIWCLLLHLRHGTIREYLSAAARPHPRREEETIIETAIDAPSEEVVERMPSQKLEPARVPLLPNYLLSALAGVTWYFQFFFYTMGESQMGEEYKFSCWTLHMASIIIFSTLWGIALREWKGASRRTRTLVALALLALVGSTVVVGYGNYLAPEVLSGKVVAIAGDRLVIETKDGKEERIVIQSGTAISIEGKPAEASSLQPKQPVTVTRWRDETRKIEVKREGPSAGGH